MDIRQTSRLTSAFILLVLPLACAAADFPSNREELIGPHKNIGTDVYGFKLHGGSDADLRCAGKDSVVSVLGRTDTITIVRFVKVTGPSAGTEVCPEGAKPASKGAMYSLPNEHFDVLRIKNTGIAFGALIVPFKFRLGNDKKISSSTTIAPYLGFRSSRFQGWGMEFMPVISAGLGLVPVSDPSTGTTETKAAFSVAAGITLNSATVSDFSAGILVGKDYVSKADRGLDPSVNKMWISIWLGVAR